jgi:hypothetical protein
MIMTLAAAPGGRRSGRAMVTRCAANSGTCASVRRRAAAAGREARLRRRGPAALQASEAQTRQQLATIQMDRAATVPRWQRGVTKLNQPECRGDHQCHGEAGSAWQAPLPSGPGRVRQQPTASACQAPSQ